MAAFRKNYDKKPHMGEYRTIFSAQPDDLIFVCHCGRERIFGKRLQYDSTPENCTPLLQCHNVRAHGQVTNTLHTWKRSGASHEN
jgi:hypothetical protein